MATLYLFTTDSASLNRHKITIYEGAFPFQSQIKEPSHPARTWIFTDLIPSKNYSFDWVEIDANGNTIQRYRDGNFTVGGAGSISVKSTLELKVGRELTPGTSSATFGDWIGWDLNIEEAGTGTMERGVQYSYDISTGTFALLGEGHIFEVPQRYLVRFEPKVTTVAPVISFNPWSQIIVATEQLILTSDNAGQKILLAANALHIDVFLPHIDTVPQNKLFYFESLRGNQINGSIRSQDGAIIDWMEGQKSVIHIGRNENISFYREGNSWRVHSYSGNFMTVGRMFSSYSTSEHNAVELNGQTLSSYEYSRLYEWVYNLPASAKVPFAQQGLGNNRFKFSSANNDIDGLFKIPDVRNVYEINSGILQPGDFQDQSMIDIRHHFIAVDNTSNRFPTKNTYLAMTSNRQLNNQDYELCQTNVLPTAGLTSGIVDANGTPIPTSDKMRVDSFAKRMWIIT